MGLGPSIKMTTKHHFFLSAYKSAFRGQRLGIYRNYCRRGIGKL